MAINTASSKAQKGQKGYKGMAMEGPIATWYARNTRSRIEEQRELARRIAERVPVGGRVLEVAPGPGYLSIELDKLGKAQVTGLDISESFVKIERQNAAEAGVKVDFNHGNASAMPFDDNSFDFAVCVAAFKNFTQPAQALNEFYRVLKRGGTALIVDLRRDASIEAINAEVRKMKLSWLNALMTRWTFKHVLLKNAYTRGEIEALVAQTGFKRCDIQSDLIGMEIWLEK
jgi:ubiquinone/menaquinone biosynthesis C-methylase UbiE